MSSIKKIYSWGCFVAITAGFFTNGKINSTNGRGDISIHYAKNSRNAKSDSAKHDMSKLAIFFRLFYYQALIIAESRQEVARK
jgi:hypothetical protein